MSRIFDSKSIGPRSGEAPQQMVLLLHGYGSSGADMVAMTIGWQDALPDAIFLVPNAPQRCETGRGGRQWWGPSDFGRSEMAAGAASAAPAIDAFIDRKLEQFGLTELDLALVGFSQGTMMALHIGLRRPRAVAAVVGYSGQLPGVADIAHRDFAWPPVLLIHGTADTVVPISAMHSAEADLKQLGVTVTTHVSEGLGHNFDSVGLRLGRDFIKDTLHQKR